MDGRGDLCRSHGPRYWRVSMGRILYRGIPILGIVIMYYYFMFYIELFYRFILTMDSDRVYLLSMIQI